MTNTAREAGPSSAKTLSPTGSRLAAWYVHDSVYDSVHDCVHWCGVFEGPVCGRWVVCGVLLLPWERMPPPALPLNPLHYLCCAGACARCAIVFCPACVRACRRCTIHRCRMRPCTTPPPIAGGGSSFCDTSPPSSPSHKGAATSTGRLETFSKSIVTLSTATTCASRGSRGNQSTCEQTVEPQPPQQPSRWQQQQAEALKKKEKNPARRHAVRKTAPAVSEFKIKY